MRTGRSAWNANVSDTLEDGRIRWTFSGAASAPSAGTSAKTESSPAPHQRGVPAGSGRGALRRCIGHITAAGCSHEHSSATIVAPGRAGDQHRARRERHAQLTHGREQRVEHRTRTEVSAEGRHPAIIRRGRGRADRWDGWDCGPDHSRRRRCGVTGPRRGPVAAWSQRAASQMARRCAIKSAMAKGFCRIVLVMSRCAASARAWS